MPKEAILAIIELLCMAAAVILFFIGVKNAVDTVKLESEHDSASHEKAKVCYRRSFVIIGAAIFAYLITRVFSNYTEMTAGGADFLTVCLQSLWEAVRNTGFLLLLPIVIRKTRSNRIVNED